jgi:hypothetical protein
MTEIDDFANDKEIQRSRREQAAFEKMIEESKEIVRQKFQMKEASESNFEEFWMMKSMADSMVYETMKSESQFFSLEVSLVEYHTQYRTAKDSNSGEDYYFFGLLTTKKHYPATLVYPEGIKEKIADIFTKAEIDSKENKKFSRKFYVLTKEKETLQQSFSFLSLDELSEFGQMEFELKENLCLFRNSKKPVSHEEAIEFCKLTEKMIAIFG